MKIMNEEVKKWTISAQEVLGRMTETKDKLWNDLLHEKEWSEETLELSCQYIKAINSLIDTINKVNNIKLAPEEENREK